MSALTWQGITMVIYLAGMLAIGYYAFKRTADTMGDYMLGGRSLSPAVTALSAGAAFIRPRCGPVRPSCPRCRC